jgi:hypothetical protein
MVAVDIAALQPMKAEQDMIPIMVKQERAER